MGRPWHGGWGSCGGIVGGGSVNPLPNSERPAEPGGKLEYDASNILNEFLRDDDVDNSFLNIELNTSYFSPDEFIQKFKYSNKPLLISTNIQSITSKFNSLDAFISDITLYNVPIAVIVLQESWDIPHPELISIKGYQPIIFKSRVNSRGGGVGFYVKN